MAVRTGKHWVLLDGTEGIPWIDVAAPADYDIAAFYKEQGYEVVEVEQSKTVPLWPFVPANCVGLVRGLLAIGGPFIVTPYQLYRRLTAAPRRSLLPGLSKKPKMPETIAQTTVERDDPAVTDAKEELRQAELRRRGRSATIINKGGSSGITDTATLGRSSAGSGTDTLG